MGYGAHWGAIKSSSLYLCGTCRMADTQRMVRVYDPVRAALSNVPINDTSLWPTINSSSNTIVELKAELVERKLVSSNQFTLTVQQGAHWMDESENMQWPDGTTLCVRVTPAIGLEPSRTGAVPDWSSMPFSMFHSTIQGTCDNGNSVHVPCACIQLFCFLLTRMCAPIPNACLLGTASLASREAKKDA